MLDPTVLIGGTLILVLVFAVIAFLIARSLGNRSASQRLDSLDGYLEPEWAQGAQVPDEVEQDNSRSNRSMTDQIDSLLNDRGVGAGVRAQLRKANLKLTVAEYYLLHVVSSAFFALVAFLISGVALAAIGLIAGFFVPRIYITVRQKQRLNAFNDQLADILNLWVNSLRAGFSVPQAMEAVAKEAPAPASEEFQRVVAEISIGIPMEVALENMLARIESEDLDLVFTAVNIQREVGGNLAEILDTISHTIRERVRIKGEIRTLTSSGRATGTIIGVIPIILGILIGIINPEYMGLLFWTEANGGASIPGTPIACGWPILGLGLISMGIGLAIINRITDIEV
ncbi:MAG: secretion system protein [Chloroflexi bacterium]|nr:secretion system protein [Chloroflexota bacterium]